jgi:SagB-type dehydrogenase family enzyme
MRLRRSPHLISYLHGDGIVTRNYATGHAVIGDPLVSSVLCLSAEWTTVPAISRQLPGISKRAVAELVESMVAQRLLICEGAAPDPREVACDSWQSWNPAAGFFHFSTKNMGAPSDPDAAERRLQEKRRVHEPPPKVKRYAAAPIVDLPRAKTTGEFAGVLLSRRTWRSFSSQAVTLDDIGTLMALTWGVQRTEETAGLGPVHLKTSPSSGARQPLEAYVLAVRVTGLRPALYHYVADRHCLELVKRGANRRTIAAYIPGQWWYESAAAVFMMTAVFGRTQWRYPFPRAYRSVLLEAGHVCQTFCLVATWLGLAPFCTGRFADAVVESDIRADGVSESFIYGAGVGRRPPGVAWAPAPDALATGTGHRRGRRRALVPSE